MRRTRPCTTVGSWTICSISPIPVRGSGRTAPTARCRLSGPEGEGLAEPYPSARRTKSSAVGAPEVGEHEALKGTRACRARSRPPAELDGRQDRAHHRHRGARFKIGMMNLGYNIRRLVQLERMAAAPA